MNKLLKIRDLVNLQQGKSGWYRIENKAAVTAEVYIYGVIGWDVTADQFVQDLNSITAKNIDVHVNTEGGSVWDGIAISSALQQAMAKGTYITTIVDSMAFSSGSFIMQAANKRKIMPYAEVMIHQAMVPVYGNEDDLLAAITEVRRATDKIANIYAQRAGGTVDSWIAAMKAETTYSASDAVTVGLADEVIPLPTTNVLPPKVMNSVTDKAAEPKADEDWYDPLAFSKALQEVFQ